jgi:hypothetical protein
VLELCLCEVQVRACVHASPKLTQRDTLRTRGGIVSPSVTLSPFPLPQTILIVTVAATLASYACSICDNPQAGAGLRVYLTKHYVHHQAR